MELEPENSEILTKYGEVLVKEGKDLQQAVDILKRANELDKENPDAVVAIGRCLEKMG